MNRLAFSLLLFTGCGTAVDGVSSQEEAMTKSGLESVGFSCETVSVNYSICTSCDCSTCQEDGCIHYACEFGDCYRCGTLPNDPPCPGMEILQEQSNFFEAETATLS